VSEATDNLFGEILKQGSEENKALISASVKLKKSQQKKFIGLKKDDSVEFVVEKNTDRCFGSFTIAEQAEEEAKKATGTYVFKVTM